MFLRLLVAGLLFPPRLVGIVRRHEDAEVRTIFGMAWSKALREASHWKTYWNKSYSVLLLPFFLVIGPLLIALSLFFTALTPCFAFVFTLFFMGIRSVARALRSEISALNRTAAPLRPTRPTAKK